MRIVVSRIEMAAMFSHLLLHQHLYIRKINKSNKPLKPAYEQAQLPVLWSQHSFQFSTHSSSVNSTLIFSVVGRLAINALFAARDKSFGHKTRTLAHKIFPPSRLYISRGIVYLTNTRTLQSRFLEERLYLPVEARMCNSGLITTSRASDNSLFMPFKSISTN